MLNLTGRLKILIDRTEWKFGETWVNILTLSVAYKQVAIPIFWEVGNHKGNATAVGDVGMIQRFVEEFGVERIKRVYADREFGSFGIVCLFAKQRDRFSYPFENQS